MNRNTRSVRAGSSTKAVILIRRVVQGPSFQNRVGSEYRMPRKPTVSTKNVVLLNSLINSSEKVGSGRGVPVGGRTISSGTREVSVGVKVTGVAEGTTNRSRVGMS